jgi:membrane-associated protease RseP (regulator of RpoE activity)
MSGAAAAIGFIFTLVLVILIHEASHFIMAKRFDIKVEEFFVGFGPKLWSFRRGETDYGVKAIILGGYVRIAGMNPFQEPETEDLPRTYGAKPRWQRAVVIAAGPISHFVMAGLVLWLYLVLIGQPTKFSAQVGAVEPKLNGIESPAVAAGLKPGDVIVSIDGQQVDAESFTTVLRADTAGEPLTLVVQRDGEQVTLVASPVMAKADGDELVPRLGVLMSGGTILERDRPGPVAAVGESAQITWDAVGQVTASIGRVFGPQGFGRLFTLVFGDAQRSIEDPFSVVGGARIAGQVAESGQFDAFVFLFVSFNVFVGLMNLLPLPPFDGGHLAVLGIEKITGRPVDMRKVVPVSAVIAGLLIAFTLATVYLDFVKPVPNLFP